MSFFLLYNMVSTKSTLIFLLCLSNLLANEDDILELNDTNFQTQIAQHDIALVMFYAPWCAHCKHLKPEYERAAGELVHHQPPVAMVKVDCTGPGKKTCEKYKVNGFPTLMVFRNGNFAQDYGGTREASGIVKYMKAQLGPSSREVRSVGELEDYFNAQNNDVLVVGLFEKDSDLKTAFLKMADKLRPKVRFAHTAEKELLDKYGVRDGIVLMRPQYLKNQFENDSVVFEGDVGHIQNFITKNYHGLVGLRNSDNLNDFEKPLIVGYYSIDYTRNPKRTNYWRNRILKVAQHFKEKINFAISPKDDFQNELHEYGIDSIEGDTPKILARDANNQKFIFNETFSVENFNQFVQDLLAGDKLQPYIKSEPIPENNNGHVKIAVANNFNEIITNNEKDAMVEFYAPWCGHCQKLAPIYEELGEKLKKEDVVIAKMDATANDVPANFQVTGFPTLYWVPKDNKNNPVAYEGERELKHLLSYIAKRTTLKGFDKEGKPKRQTKTEL